ncbi:MAG: ABC transporter ATP-binding protein [Vicinamibacteria bacterium]|nr:ABC transporter ATP-binding protein [Vicinamibacteria bacterium]MBP9946845.1 ABC transporter ATP-binding protein [Vicinamibacteria bacterium]
MSENNVMVEVRRLSREFKAPGPYVPPPTLADRLTSWIRPRGTEPVAPAAPPFKALDDVSFTLFKGEVVGIIGRNGAGKSTLLRILSRVMRPSSGEVDIQGRVGSLLEVGTGFHPDLSGRENVYLNGALLGMPREEIDAKLGAIAEFADVGDFMNAPLKHFSSGMYLRLAFSVAIHLDAELLLLDEVLSVGDEWFARKCAARVEQACRSGRTVLIVGHDLGTLRALCDRLLLLERGKLAMDGEPEAVIARYLALGADGEAAPR